MKDLHKDYLTAIYHNEPLKVVYNRLLEEMNARHELERGRLHREYQTAVEVLLALHEPYGSDPFEWAQAYMRQAEKAEASKDAATKEWEAKRREIEAEYFRLKQEEIEYMQKHSHSTK